MSGDYRFAQISEGAGAGTSSGNSHVVISEDESDGKRRQQRKSHKEDSGCSAEDTSYTISDHTNLLSVEVAGRGAAAVSRDGVDSCISRHPTAFALHYCKRKILQPYFRLLAVLGWRPWFPHTPPEHQCWGVRALNVVYPVLVVALLCAGYVLQLMARFRRDSLPTGRGGARLTLLEPALTATLAPLTNQSSPASSVASPLTLGHVVSVYVIPDLLHLAAYAYVFYLFRLTNNENLQTLMERVFLQSNPCHSGFLAQKRLIRLLRSFLYLGCAWVVMSLGSQLLHVCSQPIRFYLDLWSSAPVAEHVASPSCPHYILLVVMLVGVVALDCVYIAVVLTYCVQCQLVIVLATALQESIRERHSISLIHAIRDMAECGQMVELMNGRVAVPVSLLTFNFATMVVLGLSALLSAGSLSLTAVQYASTALLVVLWVSVLLAPLAQAVRVSRACGTLHRLGHEVRVRPYGYQDTSPADLDSFLLYTSTLRIRANLFCLPTTASCLCGLLSAATFTLLLLAQLQQLLPL